MWLQCLVYCLEQQFDSVIADRPMIILRLYQFFRRLIQLPILSWEFFYNRFDALCLEAQVDLESSGEIAFPTGKRQTSQHHFPMFGHVTQGTCQNICCTCLVESSIARKWQHHKLVINNDYYNLFITKLMMR